MDKKIINEIASFIKPISVSSYALECTDEKTKKSVIEEIKNQQTRNATALYKAGYRKQGETAKKFARQVEFHSVATMQDNVEYFTISALALKEILHEEFGIPYEEFATENP